MDTSLVIGCATHNNLKYTKLFLESIKLSYPCHIFIVDNGSSDDTYQWLNKSGYDFRSYKLNMGFGYAYNDALDYAFKLKKVPYLLWCGNDIVFRPDSIDYMIQAMNETDYDMFCGNEVLNKEILTTNEGALENFKYKFSFDEPQYDKLMYSAGGMNHSCIIRNKTVFDKVGYYDINFYPAYFEDNDYSMRCRLLNLKFGTVDSAIFYHFWSRTIHEGGLAQLNSQRFELNRRYYQEKWGGSVDHETHVKPFNNSDISITDRSYELNILKKHGVFYRSGNE